MMSQTQKETVFIYLDIVQETIKRRKFSKILEDYIEGKLEKNPKTQFGLLLFDENGLPVFMKDQMDAKAITKNLKSEWKSRTEESELEHGIMYCLSELAAIAQKEAGSFRIVIISDLPSNKDSQYEDAIYGLIETVRNFPTFIDIIRIGTQKFYKDDVKLRIITTKTAGGLFYAKDEEELTSILSGLTKNKQLPDLLPEGGQVIDEEYKKYYEHIATELLPLDAEDSPNCTMCGMENCNYCHNTTDVPRKCFQCGVQYHDCCAALFSYRKNIGLKHIFRCQNCEALIKLDEQFVLQINQKEHPDEYDEEIMDDLFGGPEEEEEEINEEAEEIFDVKSVEEPEVEVKEIETPAKKKDKKSLGTIKSGKVEMKMTVFGMRPVATGGAKPDVEMVDQEEKIEKPKETTELAAVKSLRAKRQQRRKRVIVCKFCSAYLKASEKTCPKCGHPVWR